MVRFRKKSDPAQDSGYYYCIRHNKVETAGECPAKDRLGPYATADEAALALHKVDERNEEWDRQNTESQGS